MNRNSPIKVYIIIRTDDPCRIHSCRSVDDIFWTRDLADKETKRRNSINQPHDCHFHVEEYEVY